MAQDLRGAIAARLDQDGAREAIADAVVRAAMGEERGTGAVLRYVELLVDIERERLPRIPDNPDELRGMTDAQLRALLRVPEQGEPYPDFTFLGK